jgi:hypothetical protein
MVRAVGQKHSTRAERRGTVSVGGPTTGFLTLNSATLFQFSRPTDANRFDAHVQLSEESIPSWVLLYSITDFMPNDLFSWSAPGQRNSDVAATRYLSIDVGVTNVINFNTQPKRLFCRLAKRTCPQAHPYVAKTRFRAQDSFPTSPRHRPKASILDVIGYDLAQAQTGPPRLGNISTRSFVQTGDNVMIGGFHCSGHRTKESDHPCHWP